MWRPTVSSDEIWHSAICHSAKGTTWKKHKYIAIRNGVYIYPEDQSKQTADAAQRKGESLTRKLKAQKSADAYRTKGLKRGVYEQNKLKREKKKQQDLADERYERAEKSAKASKNKGIRKTVEVERNGASYFNNRQSRINPDLDDSRKRSKKRRAEVTARKAQSQGNVRKWDRRQGIVDSRGIRSAGMDPNDKRSQTHQRMHKKVKRSGSGGKFAYNPKNIPEGKLKAGTTKKKKRW